MFLHFSCQKKVRRVYSQKCYCRLQQIYRRNIPSIWYTSPGPGYISICSSPSTGAVFGWMQRLWVCLPTCTTAQRTMDSSWVLSSCHPIDHPIESFWPRYKSKNKSSWKFVAPSGYAVGVKPGNLLRVHGAQRGSLRDDGDGFVQYVAVFSALLQEVPKGY